MCIEHPDERESSVLWLLTLCDCSFSYHMCGCSQHCLLTGLPASIEWWVLHFTSLVFMAVIGEWLCMRREMRDIPLGSNIGRGMATRNRVPPEPSKGLKETLSGSLKSMARVSGSSGSLKN